MSSCLRHSRIHSSWTAAAFLAASDRERVFERVSDPQNPNIILCWSVANLAANRCTRKRSLCQIHTAAQDHAIGAGERHRMHLHRPHTVFWVLLGVAANLQACLGNESNHKVSPVP